MFLIEQSDLNFPLGGSLCSLIKKSDLATLFKNPFLVIFLKKKKSELNFFYQKKFILLVNRFETSLKKSFSYK